MKDYKNDVGERMFEHQMRAFKILVANPDKLRGEAKLSSQFYCTETSIVENFDKLFGYRCDIFAKILYLRMAKGLDHAKIDFMRFIKIFEGFLDDTPKRRNQAAFQFYDVKNQGVIDIMVLMQLYNNVTRNTYFGQELLILIREYKNKNILMTAGFSRKIMLNFSTFNELIQSNCSRPSHHSVLVDEMQYIILGKQVPETRRELRDPRLIMENLSNSIYGLMSGQIKLGPGNQI
jgi:hypothetical protein